MKDYVAIIKKPIDRELGEFNNMFADSLSHADGSLHTALSYIRQRTGKRMRPMLILLMAKNYARVSMSTQHAALGLELLHTASLVHDDVVDEAGERRGQRSVNAVYDNKVAVLVGDYILSTALLHTAKTENAGIVTYLARLGQMLSNGEILQLSSNGSDQISEQTYYDVIKGKTAALFEACCAMGAMSAGADKHDVEAAAEFGQTLGMAFQIRDDIFDYYDSSLIGKPTGNDMLEGKLTLPAIHAVLATHDAHMTQVAQRVKSHEATADEIASLVAFTKDNGGIVYAEKVMSSLKNHCLDYITQHVVDDDLNAALTAYVEYVVERKL